MSAPTIRISGVLSVLLATCAFAQPQRPPNIRDVPAPQWLWDDAPKPDQAIFVHRTINIPLTEEQLREPINRAVFWGAGDETPGRVRSATWKQSSRHKRNPWRTVRARS